MIEQRYFCGPEEARVRGLPTAAVWVPAVLAAHPIPVALDHAVVAEVNHGRWIAKCTVAGCLGAETVTTDYPVFWCDTCQMSTLGGQAVKVIFPSAEDMADIERELGRRPRIHQHWAPGEMRPGHTPGQWLRAENIVQGVTGADAAERVAAKAVYWGESAVAPELETVESMSADQLEATVRGVA